MTELSFLSKNYWLAIKAIKELDPSHDWWWLREAYYDPEGNWNNEAPSIEEVTIKVSEYLLDDLRKERDSLLRETDWVGADDVPQELKDKWYPYRQALRDITETYSSLEEVVWPDKP